MALQESDVDKIIEYVKKEPRTIQDISKLIHKSWITTDSYIKQIKERNGLIDVKTFRKGTQGALKLVFYTHPDSLTSNDIENNLYDQIKNGRTKTDFDFLELFQFVSEDKKRLFLEFDDDNDKDLPHDDKIINLFQQAVSNIFCFSGNLSFVNIRKDNKSMMNIIEESLKRKIHIKVLCRINIASLNNINKISVLIEKYPDLIEIKHCYQPLRGFVIDDKLARFRNEENLELYKRGELPKNTSIFYEIYDPKWINWLQKIFWNMFRSSIDYKIRLKEIKKIY